jgi:DNA excision repair protein ERCC-3
MSCRNITLSNKLIVPAGLVRQQDLRAFYYAWNETEHKLKENEFGEVERDDFDQPIKSKKKVEKSFRSYRELFSANGNYIAFPRGNLEKIAPFLQHGYRDLRPIVPLGVRLQLNESTKEDHRWPDQERCLDAYMKKGYGIVEGDTGSGKTVVGVAAICALGMNTLILFSQTDGIDQWIDEVYTHTNIEMLEEQTGRKLIGPYKANKKAIYPITVGTVQSFLKTKGKRWLFEHRSDFGLLLIDEVHDFAAEQFCKVVQAINAFALLGLTATTERPDRRHHLLFDIVGPVVARGTAKQMPPTVYFIETGTTCPTWQYERNFPKHYQWKEVLKHIVADEDRYELIQKYLRKDVDNKRTIACISPVRTAVVKKLYKMLSQDGYDVRYVDGKTPKALRKMIYREVREGKVQILFAGKVLNQLVNLPVIDCLHFVTPVSSLKNTKQAYGRARRWLAGKQNPIIRDYVDEGGGQLEGAYKNRMRLCRAEGWTVKVIDAGMANLTGLSLWKKHGKKK